MEATLLFPAGRPNALTTSDIFVDGLDVYELRSDLRGTPVAFRTDGYWGGARTEVLKPGWDGRAWEPYN